MVFVKVLVDLELVGLAVDGGAQGLVQGWQGVAGDHHHRAMDLGNNADSSVGSVVAG